MGATLPGRGRRAKRVAGGAAPHGGGRRAKRATGAALLTARTLAIEGRVQGVGYRDAMVDAALAAGVQGTVRNADDGRVLAHVQGNEAAVAAIIAWASHGPAFARVARVLVEAAEPDPAHTTFCRIR